MSEAELLRRIQAIERELTVARSRLSDALSSSQVVTGAAPRFPAQEALWADTDGQQLKVWSGGAWQVLLPGTAVSATQPDAAAFRLWVDLSGVTPALWYSDGSTWTQLL